MINFGNSPCLPQFRYIYCHLLILKICSVKVETPPFTKETCGSRYPPQFELIIVDMNSWVSKSHSPIFWAEQIQHRFVNTLTCSVVGIRGQLLCPRLTTTVNLWQLPNTQINLKMQQALLLAAEVDLVFISRWSRQLEAWLVCFCKVEGLC